MCSSIVRLGVLCAALSVGVAHADGPYPRADPAADPTSTSADEPKVGWALAAGAATALVPLAAGGAVFSSTYDTHKRRDSVLGMMSGIALAPIVSHLVAKEWTRAAIFGAIPVACAIGSAVLLELQPSADLYGTPQTRLTFGLLISFATLSSGIGLFDTMGAVRRHAAAAGGSH